MNKFLAFVLIFFACNSCFAQINDEIADSLSLDVEAVKTNLDYDYSSVIKLPIKIRIKERIKTEKDLYEGQIVEFEVVKHVYYKNCIVIKAGSIVKAKIKTIITPGMNGIPASIIFGDFEIKNIKQARLTDSYELFGQDRSLLVFPLKWALTFLPPTGSLTNFIMGGHAKLKPKKTLEIYYYPEWM